MLTSGKKLSFSLFSNGYCTKAKLIKLIIFIHLPVSQLGKEIRIAAGSINTYILKYLNFYLLWSYFC